MKTDRARKQLGWKPKHTAKATLKEMVRPALSGANRSLTVWTGPSRVGP